MSDFGITDSWRYPCVVHQSWKDINASIKCFLPWMINGYQVFKVAGYQVFKVAGYQVFKVADGNYKYLFTIHVLIVSSHIGCLTMKRTLIICLLNVILFLGASIALMIKFFLGGSFVFVLGAGVALVVACFFGFGALHVLKEKNNM